MQQCDIECKIVIKCSLFASPSACLNILFALNASMGAVRHPQNEKSRKIFFLADKFLLSASHKVSSNHRLIHDVPYCVLRSWQGNGRALAQSDLDEENAVDFSALLYFRVVRCASGRIVMVREQVRARTIVRNPRILFGEPIIEGARILVRSVVLFHYSYGNIAGVLSALPTLSASDVETALRFYREHRDEINKHIAENTEGEDIPYDELVRFSPSEVAQW